ncbi:putative hydro-lyase [Bifidobacterium sp.]|uniref:putative hydro-lyase n=1 Tax=Bifidobacterium sp. TaxID=41200 RepID=UPI0025BAD352|nr:putative hydro-lyase [Bifidobacterium sp.]MCI1635945.1 putative hydro-lyase [Bifidobacterium sp.]
MSIGRQLVLDQQTTPAEARQAFRQGVIRPTAGISKGFAQANMIVLPKAYAYDFLLFAQRNPKPCPLLEVLDVGSTAPSIAPGSDIRSDIPKYRIWHDGKLVDEVNDITDVWAEHDDLVTFLIGCSFTFEFPLMEAGIPVHHIEADTNVPMYDTSISCASAGMFTSSMVVSMRGIQPNQVADAVRISGYYPSVHGAPVHIGNPSAIGIKDLTSPQYGDKPILKDGDIPVFWACGVTPQAAVMSSKPSFAITHAPGHMFITDMPDQHYMV